MDEIVAYVPGNHKLLELKKDEEGYHTPLYEYDPISYEYGHLVQQGMEKAMDEILSPLIDGQSIARADFALGQAWSAK